MESALSPSFLPFEVRNVAPLTLEEEPLGAFCDWLSIYQSHDHLPAVVCPETGRRLPPMPVVNAGCVISVDADGQVEFTTDKTIEVEGSHDTCLRLRCDGWKVSLSGNIGRFRRPDNVWGYTVSECVKKANDLLAEFGLLPFSSRQVRHEGVWRDMGCVITRVDLTANYFAGSMADADQLCRYFAGQGAGRKAPKPYGAAGVSWGEGSKYWYAKFYNKSREIVAHPGHVTDVVRRHIETIGLCRHEISLKSRYLDEHGLKSLLRWQPTEGQLMENVVYGRFSEILTRNSVNVQDVDAIPGKTGLYAAAYRAGKDIWGDQDLTLRARQMIRKKLLAYGIDIKQPLNVMSLVARPRVIELRCAYAPEWYWATQGSKEAA
jgi:hypothetical protein